MLGGNDVPSKLCFGNLVGFGCALGGAIFASEVFKDLPLAREDLRHGTALPLPCSRCVVAPETRTSRVGPLPGGDDANALSARPERFHLGNGALHSSERWNAQECGIGLRDPALVAG